MNWKDRQTNDRYVKERNDKNLLSRAYFKLEEIDKKFNFFNNQCEVVVEFGASPGGWTQYLVSKVKHIYAYDILPIKIKSKNLTFIQKSVFDIQSIEKCDILLSDMAPNLSGNQCVDQYAMENLLDKLLFFCNKKITSYVVFKLFQNNMHFLLNHKNLFRNYKFFKPQASRKESDEIYFIGKL